MLKNLMAPIPEAPEPQPKAAKKKKKKKDSSSTEEDEESEGGSSDDEEDEESEEESKDSDDEESDSDGSDSSDDEDSVEVKAAKKVSMKEARAQGQPRVTLFLGLVIINLCFLTSEYLFIPPAFPKPDFSVCDFGRSWEQNVQHENI